MGTRTLDMSYKMEKVNEVLAHEVGIIINKIISKNKGTLTTVTACECSKDLRSAVIWISILGNKKNESLDILNKNIYEIQGLLNKRMKMKYVPRIKFRLDRSHQKYDRIEKILKNNKTKEDNTLDKNKGWL